MNLDTQIANFAPELKMHLGFEGEVALKIASTVGVELRFLSTEGKRAILSATPVDVSARLAELAAFQAFAEQVHAARKPHPAAVRAQLVYQNYICFVYLGEALFRVLAKSAPSDSVTRKCARFLTDNPVRAFRNAVAHGNWRYRDDFTGLVFWSRKGSDSAEPLTQFEVDQRTLNFWQALARAVAYVAYRHLQAGAHPPSS